MNSWDQTSECLERFRSMLSRSSARRAIVLLLLEGCSRKQIALKMSRSPHTIDAHMKAMYREVGVGNRARLMLLAIKLREYGELPPPLQNWLITTTKAIPHSRGVVHNRSGDG